MCCVCIMFPRYVRTVANCMCVHACEGVWELASRKVSVASVYGQWCHYDVIVIVLVSGVLWMHHLFLMLMHRRRFSTFCLWSPREPRSISFTATSVFTASQATHARATLSKSYSRWVTDRTTMHIHYRQTYMYTMDSLRYKIQPKAVLRQLYMLRFGYMRCTTVWFCNAHVTIYRSYATKLHRVYWALVSNTICKVCF